MLTVFDKIKDDINGIVVFSAKVAISFGREVLENAFDGCSDEDFKEIVMKAYNNGVNSDLFKYKFRKQIREALLNEIGDTE